MDNIVTTVFALIALVNAVFAFLIAPFTPDSFRLVVRFGVLAIMFAVLAIMVKVIST